MLATSLTTTIPAAGAPRPDPGADHGAAGARPDRAAGSGDLADHGGGPRTDDRGTADGGAHGGAGAGNVAHHHARPDDHDDPRRRSRRGATVQRRRHPRRHRRDDRRRPRCRAGWAVFPGPSCEPGSTACPGAKVFRITDSGWQLAGTYDLSSTCHMTTLGMSRTVADQFGPCTTAPPQATIIRPGRSGSEVAALQVALVGLGYPIGVDGTYGPAHRGGGP